MPDTFKSHYEKHNMQKNMLKGSRIQHKEINDELRSLYLKIVKNYHGIKEEEILVCYIPFFEVTPEEITGQEVPCPTYFIPGIKAICSIPPLKKKLENHPEPKQIKAMLIANIFYENLKESQKRGAIAHELGHCGHAEDDGKKLKYQIDADTKAAKAGYGEELLDILKTFSEGKCDNNLKTRINNLERIVKNQRDNVPNKRKRGIVSRE